MPSLEYLTIRSYPYHSSDFWIRRENIPALRILEFADSTTLSTTSPLTNITDLLYHIGSLDALIYNETNILFNLPNLVQLALRLRIIPNVEHRIVLPSLTSLEVRLTAQQSIDRVLYLFAAFPAPNLRSLVLDVGGGQYDYAALLQSLGQRMPELRSLYFINSFYHSPWPTILPILTPYESRAVIFPDLQEVVFLTDGSDPDVECFDGHYELLRDFLLARGETLAQLSIPRVKNGDVLNPLRDYTPPLETSKPYTSRRFSFIRDLRRGSNSADVI